MKTRITDLFGIQYPIILSGMSWISTPEPVARIPSPPACSHRRRQDVLSQWCGS